VAVVIFSVVNTTTSRIMSLPKQLRRVFIAHFKKMLMEVRARAALLALA